MDCRLLVPIWKLKKSVQPSILACQDWHCNRRGQTMRTLVLLLTTGSLAEGCEKLDNLSTSQRGADDLAEHAASSR
jgi:hypothetical protein